MSVKCTTFQHELHVKTYYDLIRHLKLLIEHCFDYTNVMGTLNNFVPSDSDSGPLCTGPDL